MKGHIILGIVRIFQFITLLYVVINGSLEALDGDFDKLILCSAILVNCFIIEFNSGLSFEAEKQNREVFIYFARRLGFEDIVSDFKSKE